LGAVEQVMLSSGFQPVSGVVSRTFDLTEADVRVFNDFAAKLSGGLKAKLLDASSKLRLGSHTFNGAVLSCVAGSGKDTASTSLAQQIIDDMHLPDLCGYVVSPTTALRDENSERYEELAMTQHMALPQIQLCPKLHYLFLTEYFRYGGPLARCLLAAAVMNNPDTFVFLQGDHQQIGFEFTEKLAELGVAQSQFELNLVINYRKSYSERVPEQSVPTFLKPFFHGCHRDGSLQVHKDYTVESVCQAIRDAPKPLTVGTVTKAFELQLRERCAQLGVLDGVTFGHASTLQGHTCENMLAVLQKVAKLKDCHKHHYVLCTRHTRSLLMFGSPCAFPPVGACTLQTCKLGHWHHQQGRGYFGSLSHIKPPQQGRYITDVMGIFLPGFVPGVRGGVVDPALCTISTSDNIGSVHLDLAGDARVIKSHNPSSNGMVHPGVLATPLPTVALDFTGLAIEDRRSHAPIQLPSVPMERSVLQTVESILLDVGYAPVPSFDSNDRTYTITSLNWPIKVALDDTTNSFKCTNILLAPDNRAMEAPDCFQFVKHMHSGGLLASMLTNRERTSVMSGVDENASRLFDDTLRANFQRIADDAFPGQLCDDDISGVRCAARFGASMAAKGNLDNLWPDDETTGRLNSLFSVAKTGNKILGSFDKFLKFKGAQPTQGQWTVASTALYATVIEMSIEVLLAALDTDRFVLTASGVAAVPQAWRKLAPRCAGHSIIQTDLTQCDASQRPIINELMIYIIRRVLSRSGLEAEFVDTFCSLLDEANNSLVCGVGFVLTTEGELMSGVGWTLIKNDMFQLAITYLLYAVILAYAGQGDDNAFSAYGAGPMTRQQIVDAGVTIKLLESSPSEPAEFCAFILGRDGVATPHITRIVAKTVLSPHSYGTYTDLMLSAHQLAVATILKLFDASTLGDALASQAQHAGIPVDQMQFLLQFADSYSKASVNQARTLLRKNVIVSMFDHDHPMIDAHYGHRSNNPNFFRALSKKFRMMQVDLDFSQLGLEPTDADETLDQ
jgi:hypothetical protein